ncbi:hypothetical protein FBQ80_00330 [Candidatus Brocadia sp. AMX2]|uniref:hypothetical protein n=1 Tax=Candidatus Brocadia TaxID=380240 RepID=UPI0012FF4E56|nr:MULTISPECIES: hypothetical protein [Brocadia]MCK6466926.1 hypothetical protein [Candidatus Brocadia sinica]MDL1934028.1 hypothetical protein [Candidatus Brocadia sp. AMX2]NOG41322.1 hypothetical protein [Planctomycetota bacterium]NUO05063.1 hypothetical protein [Candidatus Brocadia sinica]
MLKPCRWLPLIKPLRIPNLCQWFGKCSFSQFKDHAVFNANTLWPLLCIRYNLALKVICELSPQKAMTSEASKFTKACSTSSE